MKPISLSVVLSLLMAGLSLTIYAAEVVSPPLHPPGEPKKTSTSMLQMGAGVLQRNAPLKPLDVYMVGFKPFRGDPAQQVELHQFCNQVNEEFAQCVLFDGNTRDANLNGVEYIISERLYETLPQAERQYWHPRNYEILSGQLVAPGIPPAAEHRLLSGQVNTYAKTWMLWKTGTANGLGTSLPLGAPELAWSFNRDGEMSRLLAAARDKVVDASPLRKREQRHDLLQRMRPQDGVNVLRGRFGNDTQDLPGIVDRAEAAGAVGTSGDTGTGRANETPSAPHDGARKP